MMGLSAMFPRVEVFLIQGSPVDMLERPLMDGKFGFDHFSFFIAIKCHLKRKNENTANTSGCSVCRVLFPRCQAEPAFGAESAT